jgi:zinc-ribbon domain
VSLVCPSCGREHSDEQRFCEACGVPLVVEGGPAEAEVSERGERARKIKRQYAEGELVRVAIGRQQPEAELIQNILLEEGVPSTLRRTRGFDVPEMLAAGPRDVLVPQSGVEAAREVLLQADMADAESGRQPVQPRQVVIGLSVAVVVVFAVALLIDAVA